MADDFEDTSDPIDASGSEDQPDEGPTQEELDAAALPDEREEREAARKAREQPVPDHRDQQIANLNRAMRQEREQKRAAKQATRALEQRQRLIEQRHEIIMQRVAAATGADLSDLTGAQRQPPEADTDPIGHLTGRMQQMVDPLLQKINGLEHQLATRELNGQVAEVDRFVADDTAAFAADHPDYDEAEDYVLESMATDTWRAAKAQYPNADEDDLAAHVEQYIGRAIGNLKVGAFRDRKSLASVVYSVAQQKGWGGQQQQPAPGRRQQRGKVGELQRNLQRTGANMALERSPRKAPLSLQGLADLDDEEFDRLTSDPKAWKKYAEAAAL